MKSIDVNLHKPSYWQVVFLQSKVNGATYNGEALPRRRWDWPKKYVPAAPLATGYVSRCRSLKIQLTTSISHAIHGRMKQVGRWHCQ